MKYVALLRGINVGGNNIIKMADLKQCFEDNTFLNVSTYIQSGNVLFESDETDTEKLEKQLETMLHKKFTYPGKVLVRSDVQMRKVVKQAPNDWNSRDDIRCYIAFLKQPLTSQKAIEAISLREGVDTIHTGPGVVYMTSLMEHLTKSKLNKLASLKIYQLMTIRNYNTTRKIVALMDT